MACQIHSLQLFSVQINIFTRKIVSRLNITCKTIFILSLTLFQYQDKEMGKKIVVKIDSYCFELLARAMITKLKLTARVKFDDTNNNKYWLIHSKAVRNHVWLEKTSRHYQIHFWTRWNTAAILRIYFTHTLFHRLSHFCQAITCTNQIWPVRRQEIWVRD